MKSLQRLYRTEFSAGCKTQWPSEIFKLLRSSLHSLWETKMLSIKSSGFWPQNNSRAPHTAAGLLPQCILVNWPQPGHSVGNSLQITFQIMRRRTFLRQVWWKWHEILKQKICFWSVIETYRLSRAVCDSGVLISGRE